MAAASVMSSRAGSFIFSFTSFFLIWTICPIFAALHPRPGFDSLHQTGLASISSKNLAPYCYESGSVRNRPFSSIAPLPAAAPPAICRKQKKKRAPPPHGIKTVKVKRRRRKDKKKLNSARTVGYFFAGIAILLQVAVVVFLLIKRKQMIGVVRKYDEANGIYAPA